MTNIIINFKKKYILPRRWKKAEMKKAAAIIMPPEDALVQMQKALKSNIVLFERKNDRIKVERAQEALRLVEALMENRSGQYLDNIPNIGS